MLKHLHLKNFRSHKSFDLDLEKTNILVGLNGAGKTNVLEAVFLASCGRSFREEDKRNLVNFDADFGRVTADEIEIIIVKSPRLITRAKERGVGKRVLDLVGKIPAVIFSPESLDIVTGAPQDRRRFLDIMISQVDREYLSALSSYTKIRRQRNQLLQRIACGEAGEDELSFWDSQLVNEALIINKKRSEALTGFNKKIVKYYKEISSDKSTTLKIIYHSRSGDNLANKLAENRAREIAYGGTIYGPHRDDLEFVLNGKSAANYASRGETRSIVLALKIAELNFLEEAIAKNEIKWARGTKPILLLDDIFSEFDALRREHLSGLILEHQTLITTTERGHLDRELLGGQIITLR
jgi:DNA replication and repair protein RecF